MTLPLIAALPLAQVNPGEAISAWNMIVHGTISTKVIIAILALFSLMSWGMILWKFFQFRRLWGQAGRFLDHMERSERLEEAYRGVLSLPESPFSRVFRRGVTFFSELRPGALREGVATVGLSPAQLEVLRLVLEKEEGEERDELGHGLHWLAIIASVSPLLGLLGTVLGVMNAFIGVAAVGSSNIGAVAPGVAEALITTVAGLVVAIPAAMGYNYFATRLQLFMSELEGFSSEFIGTLAREGKI
ncbi:MAG TPA: MotA/TolQ/ExbB proton channel family protein [Longimicrobiaceae bacterium]|nr:MotA/TolQ/ExbB proton channel family protein [Longimicrobiaceae bacterium]